MDSFCMDTEYFLLKILLYKIKIWIRTENPRVGGSIPSLTTFKPFDFVEGLFVYRLNQIESNIKFYGYYFNN